MVTRRGPPRLERKRTGPPAWWVGPRRARAAEGPWAGQAAPEARAHEARWVSRLSAPAWGGQGRPGGAGAEGPGAGHQSGDRAWQPAAQEARVKRAWPRTRGVPGRAGLITWHGRCAPGGSGSGNPPRSAVAARLAPLPPGRDGLSGLRREGAAHAASPISGGQGSVHECATSWPRFDHHRTRQGLPPRKLRRDIQ